MDFSHLLISAMPKEKSLIDFGFHQEDGFFVLKKNIPETDFYALIKISKQQIKVSVYDFQTGDCYSLFDNLSATGTFVGEVRMKVQTIMDEILKRCFESTDVKKNYVDFVMSKFPCTEDFPWGKFADYSVYRCPNEKWFALVMKIKFTCLGLQSEEKVWVVNLKAECNLIPELVDKKNIFPAYHMNKKNWITVLLTSTTDFTLLQDLTKSSFNLVDQQSKKKK